MNLPERPPERAPERAPELSPLQRAFLALERAEARAAAAEAGAREPIAIVGLSCRVPGAADAPAFWELLSRGVDAVGPVPGGRFDLDGIHDPQGDRPGHSVTREAGFLPDVAGFDPEFFGITRREAHGMDPQQRLLLEVSWEALEHAAQPPDRLSHSATGVYFGVCSSDYVNLQIRTGDPTLLDAHYTSGNAHSVASGRVSYLLGLQGPAVTVDTACSSSLVAVHLACQALRARECRMALAGGVNLMLSPELFVAFSNTRMLARDGRCKTFDAAADGFGRGEGCGVVVLKRLSDAQADGDRVLAVIRGSAVNQDGPSSGLTAPNGPAQEAVIREALQRAGLQPQQVGVIEAHGTGTELGDPLEVQALGHVFGPGRDAQRPLWLGSVKTNLGHLEAAAGVTGLIKLVLALRHGQVPPHLHLQQPSPHIAWSQWPVRVPTRLEPWEPIDGRRIGGVSSFGFSGTNAHIVVEQAPDPAPTAAPAAVPAPVGGTQLFVLSAHNGAALAELARRYAQAFAPLGDEALRDVCHTAAVARASLPERATLLVRSMAELREGLQALADARPSPVLRQRRVSRRDPPRVALLFTGQGAQYPGMAAALHRDEPVFRAAFDQCAAVLDPLLGESLHDVVFDATAPRSRLDRTAFTQPALFAVEYALTRLWAAWGVRPDALIGHSVGELVAACVAGVMTLDDALRLVAERGRLMQALPAGGAMAALQAPQAVVQAALQASGLPVDLAALNAPDQVVVAGAEAAVQQLCERLAVQGVRSQRLPVSHAFHSRLVEPMLDTFEAVAASLPMQRPALRIVSNLSGQWARADELTQAGYWRRHVREPVRFAEGLATLRAAGADVLLEVGPQPTLLALTRADADTGDDVARVPSLRAGRADGDVLREALASLYLAGVTIDWRAVHAAAPARLVDLPAYPFQRERCWFTPAQAVLPHGGPHGGLPTGLARPSGHPLLGVRLRSAVPGLVCFDTELDPRQLPWLRDHRVQGRIILPATGHIELALAAGQAVLGRVAALHGLVIGEPLVVDEGEARAVQVLVRPSGPDEASLEILSLDAAADTWHRHAEARLAPATPGAADLTLAEHRAACGKPLTVTAHRARLQHHGLQFGDSLHGLQALWQGEAGPTGQALGEVHLPAAAGGGAYLAHPALLDACLQVVAAALPASVGAEGAYLPLVFDRIELIRPLQGTVWSHAVVQPGRSTGVLQAEVTVHDALGLAARLAGITLRPAAPARSAWYQVSWTARPEDSGWPAPAALAAAMAGHLDALATREGLDDHHRAMVEIEHHSATWMALALRALGWRPHPGDRVQASALARQLGVAPRYGRLLHRWLAVLGEIGCLRPEAGITDGGDDAPVWVVAQALPEGDPLAAVRALHERHPGSRPHLDLIARCGPALPDILRGTLDPLQVLFPDGSTAQAEALYRDTPEARVYQQFVRDAVVRAQAQRPAGRRLRVLEVGGGTGGTTAWLAPALPADACDYLFTDLGAALVARARERFGPDHPFMRFATLDLEQDFAAQGLGDEPFDLIVAANVIHATADLRQTLSALRAVLAPGGLLLMIEVTAPERWIDLSFGLTEGWWRFTDTALRPHQPLLGRPRWLELLADLDFEAHALDPEDPRAREVVLAARRPQRDRQPALPSGRWLLIGSGDGLAAALAAMPGECLVRPPEADLRAWLGAHAAQAAGVIVLSALDVPALDDSRPDAGADAAQALLAPVLDVVQALGALAFDPGRLPRLWLLTRGAQPVHGVHPLDAAQAAVAGLARVIDREHPEWRTTTLDLDPAQPAALQAPAVAGLLAQAGRERQLARRGSQTRAARLAPMPESPPLPARVRLAAPDSGVIDALHLVPAEPVAPGPGQVEIRVLAAGLNFRDVMNAVALRTDPEPLGGECAGRIVAVGEGVQGLAVGDDVLATAAGCFASHVLAEAADVCLLPPGVTHAQAASVPFAFMTAWHALVELAALRAGQTVLIHAAAGGVGQAAVQLAQRCGATVIATAGSPEKQALLRAQGVAHVLHSRTLDFTARVHELTRGRGVDVVLNSLAGDFIEASLACLAEDGCFLEIGKRDIWSAAQVAQVRPRARYHMIDLAAQRHADRPAARALFEQVVSLLRRGEIRPLPVQAFALDDAAAAFRCMAQARHVGKVVLVTERGERSRTDRLDPHGSYLVTGGLSGLGLLTAGHLVAHGARHLLLVGRRAPGEAAAGQIAAWRAAGVQVRTMQADLARSVDVTAVLAEADAHLPVLRGVVHSAGLLDDGALMQQDWARFARPLGPKLSGAWALHVLTRERSLDFFVLYSSVAGTLGSSGQGNHAAANAFLDALAAHRRAQGLPAQSIAWGAWSEIGAAADREVDRRVGERGIGSITPTQGLAWLDALMAHGPTHAVVFPVDWARLQAAEGGATVPPFLEQVMPPPRARAVTVSPRPAAALPVPAAAGSAPAAGPDPIDTLRQASAARRPELLQALVAEQVAQVIQAPDATRIDLRQPLNELGLDSLMAVDLRNRLGQQLGLGRSLPATLVFDHPTIDALSHYLLKQLFPQDDSPPRAPAGTVAPAAAAPRADTVGAIDDLSDDEVEALLAQRMRRP